MPISGDVKPTAHQQNCGRCRQPLIKGERRFAVWAYSRYQSADWFHSTCLVMEVVQLLGKDSGRTIREARAKLALEKLRN